MPPYRYLFLLATFCLGTAHAAPELHYRVEAQAAFTDVPRLGLNLGEWTAWGAAQLSGNILKNPGFEGLIDRALVIVKTADNFGFTDDTAWTKRPDGFWAGAHYAVRSGHDAGKQGQLFDSKASGGQGLPEFTVSGAAPTLQAGDVVSLTRDDDRHLPAQWWFAKDLLPGQASVSTDTRPQSLGQRALLLQPQMGKPIETLSYWDGIGDRAGKLLPVQGGWTLRFWLKQVAAGATVTVKFHRINGGKAFFQETFRPTATWQLIERRFNAKDDGPAAPLALSFLVEGEGGGLLIDDAELGADNSGTFRPEVVAALKTLQPGYLRDWQGQLGDSFGNRIADSFARRSSRYRPGEESAFGYGLNDFLRLAQTVGAQPWLIIPPTLDDEELTQFGVYLRQQIEAYGFKEVMVEFGNENWNAVFRPAGIPNYTAHGEVATRAFQYLLNGAKHHPAIRTVVNGQYVNPWLSTKILDGVSNAHGLAIAPYFLFKLDETDDVLAKLFDQDDFFTETLTATKARGKELMVYEVNLHTTSGNAPLALRNRATTSAAAGAALAKRLLTALNKGISKQCVYTLAQYDTFIEPSGQRQAVKLWGLARDLGANPRLRPTGLAMAMLNQALPADVYRLTSEDADANAITLTALRHGNAWGLAAVSSKAEPQMVTVQFPPPSGKQTWRLLRLSAPTPFADNENQAQVTITEEPLVVENATVRLTMPAYGLAVLVAGQTTKP
ncbi:MAG: hypothetical protein PHU14_06460 [Methylovulum sp.]|nr:hypothetical protein [Methylovulum sp.]